MCIFSKTEEKESFKKLRIACCVGRPSLQPLLGCILLFPKHGCFVWLLHVFALFSCPAALEAMLERVGATGRWSRIWEVYVLIFHWLCDSD